MIKQSFLKKNYQVIGLLLLLTALNSCEKKAPDTTGFVDVNSTSSINLMNNSTAFSKVFRFEQNSGGFTGDITPGDFTYDGANFNFLYYYSNGNIYKASVNGTTFSSVGAAIPYYFPGGVSTSFVDGDYFIPFSNIYIRLSHNNFGNYTYAGDINVSSIQAFSNQGGFNKTGILRMFLQGAATSNWAKYGLGYSNGTTKGFTLLRPNEITAVHVGSFEPISTTEGIITELKSDSLLILSQNLNQPLLQPTVVTKIALQKPFNSVYYSSAGAIIHYTNNPNEYITDFHVRMFDPNATGSVNTYYLNYIVKYNIATKLATILKQGIRYEESAFDVYGVLDDVGNRYMIKQISGTNGYTYDFVKNWTTGATTTVQKNCFTNGVTNYKLKCINGIIYALLGRGITASGSEATKELELYKYNP